MERIKARSLPSLTKAEEEIMHIVWQLEPCLVRDVIDHLGQPDIPHSTVSSVVRILEKKGFVTHKAYGKTHEYRAVVTKEEYAQQNVKSLIKKYFGGSPSQLVSFLVKENDLDLKELNKLMQSLTTKKK
jgi:predicted transcriptional regulator